MKAQSLRSLDEEYRAHKQAWINQQVKATKQQGSKTVPVYRKFIQFFDYEKQENNILGIKKESKKAEIFRLLKKANS